MNGLIGCLFIIIFGGIFLVIGFANMLFHALFGRNIFTGRTFTRRRPDPQGSAQAGSTASAGNAHHETGKGNSRQRRNNKIFEKNEGQYVDFEEVP